VLTSLEIGDFVGDRVGGHETTLVVHSTQVAGGGSTAAKWQRQ
jgi:hypothetical protein